ncbi:MAG: fumarate hydratase C-terminal domain-containing protein, partial [Eubacteriales bacterium]|nr:fumarate hydratase C-terminal domain-containing protein [Eubacteriales bacterium]
MKKTLSTPITAADLEDIQIGDILYLNGSLITCRDLANLRLVEQNRALPA